MKVLKCSQMFIQSKSSRVIKQQPNKMINKLRHFRERGPISASPPFEHNLVDRGLLLCCLWLEQKLPRILYFYQISDYQRVGMKIRYAHRQGASSEMNTAKMSKWKIQWAKHESSLHNCQMIVMCLVHSTSVELETQHFALRWFSKMVADILMH